MRSLKRFLQFEQYRCYRFHRKSAFRPNVGIGIRWVYFWTLALADRSG